MLARSIRSAVAAVAFVSVLGSAFPAIASPPPRPLPTCGACQPIGVMTVLVIFVGVVNTIEGLIP